MGLNTWCHSNSVSFKSHSISVTFKFCAVRVALCALEPRSTDSLGTQHQNLNVTLIEWHQVFTPIMVLVTLLCLILYCTAAKNRYMNTTENSNCLYRYIDWQNEIAKSFLFLINISGCCEAVVKCRRPLPKKNGPLQVYVTSLCTVI